jgi:hypothetical protein
MKDEYKLAILSQHFENIVEWNRHRQHLNKEMDALIFYITPHGNILKHDAFSHLLADYHLTFLLEIQMRQFRGETD